MDAAQKNKSDRGKPCQKYTSKVRDNIQSLLLQNLADMFVDPDEIVFKLRNKHIELTNVH